VGIYAASKAAVIMLTQSAAAELGPRGIRVNAVAPGLVETDLIAGLPEAILTHAKGQTPLERRLGTPEEIGKAVLFLATPQASWVTSQIIELAGGM
jgi:3-oxoacyl-[acyl-carrier protein] reductase